jgi:hypothetical protein
LRDALAGALSMEIDDSGGIDVAVDLDGFFDDEPPVELVRRRTSLPSPATASLVPADASALPPRAADDDDLHVPLVRTKPVTVPPAQAPVLHIPTSAVPREAAELARAAAVLSASPAPSSSPTTPPKESLGNAAPSAAPIPSDARPLTDLWSSLPPAPVRTARPVAAMSSSAPAGTGTVVGHPAPTAIAGDGANAPVDTSEAEALLASIRAAATRDEAVRLGCQAAAPSARCAVFLGLKRDVLQGRDASGAGVSRAAVQRLWIPVKSASVFRDAVANGTRYLGPFGTTSADGVFQAAIGSRGGEVLVQPVLVAGKAVAVLCADGVHEGGAARIERVARALGEAFERLILSKKA